MTPDDPGGCWFHSVTASARVGLILGSVGGGVSHHARLPRRPDEIRRQRRTLVVRAAAEIAGRPVGVRRRHLAGRRIAECHPPEFGVDSDGSRQRLMCPSGRRIRQVAHDNRGAVATFAIDGDHHGRRVDLRRRSSARSPDAWCVGSAASARSRATVGSVADRLLSGTVNSGAVGPAGRWRSASNRPGATGDPGQRVALHPPEEHPDVRDVVTPPPDVDVADVGGVGYRLEGCVDVLEGERVAYVGRRLSRPVAGD